MSAKDQIKQIVDYFKREPQLKDKTDGMAEGLLLGAQLADDANELSKETDASFKALQREYTENGNGSQTTAEITVARDGELVLDDRLKRDFGNVNAQLAHTGKKAKAIGTALSNVSSVQRGIFTVVTDDSFQADYRYMLPTSRQLGVPFCTAVITDRLNQPDSTTVDQLKEMQDLYGWEILSHTQSHARLGELPRSVQEVEMRDSRDILLSHGLNVESIAYPYGSYNDDTIELARKYYRSARSTDRGLNGFNLPPIDTYALKTLWMDSNAVIPNDPSGLQVNTLEYYKWYIDKASEKNGWITILLHSNYTEFDNYGDLLKDVINYAKEKMDILTVSQALDRFGNIVDSGISVEDRPYKNHFLVGHDGTMASNNLDFKFAETNRFTSSNSIDDFEDFKVTVNRINTVTATQHNMPDGTGGTLMTYKLVDKNSNSQVYNFQLFYTLYDNNIYQRYVNNDKSWGPFYLVSNKLFIDRAVSSVSQATAFKEGMTVTNINNTTALSLNLPEKKGGTLITYKPNKSSLGYSWQEYYIYGTNRIYRRFFNDSGSPTDWFTNNSISTVATNWVEVQARSTYDIMVDLNVNNTVYNANPVSNMPGGVIWNNFSKNNKLVIRIANLNDVAIGIDAMDWNVNINHIN